MRNYREWQQTGLDFKIFFLPAVPVVFTFVLGIIFFVTGRVLTFLLWIILALWVFYGVFVMGFKIKERFVFALIRTWLIGKNKKSRNENSPLQY